jgi:3-methyladenine DNA glycosylase/8-oxoguanine DNA glycosylase
MLFALDKPQAFPVDVWIVKAMRDWYPDAPVPPALNSNGNKTTPTEKHKREMREWALERYGMHAGYANQYMFHHKRWVDLVRVSG